MQSVEALGSAAYAVVIERLVAKRQADGADVRAYLESKRFVLERLSWSIAKRHLADGSSLSPEELSAYALQRVRDALVARGGAASDIGAWFDRNDAFLRALTKSVAREVQSRFPRSTKPSQGAATQPESETPPAADDKPTEPVEALLARRRGEGRIWIAYQFKTAPTEGQRRRWLRIIERKLEDADKKRNSRKRAFWEGVQGWVLDAAAGAPTAKADTSPKDAPRIPDRRARAARLRELAAKVSEEIEALRNSGTRNQNPTRRRAGIIASQDNQAERLERVKTALLGLAAALEGNCEPGSVQRLDLGAESCLPASLEGVDTRRLVEELLSRDKWPAPGMHRHFMAQLLNATDGARGVKEAWRVVTQVERRCSEYWCGLQGTDDVAAVETLLRTAEKRGTLGKYDARNAREELNRFKRALAAGLRSQDEWERARADLRALMQPVATVPPKERQIRDAERDLIGRKLPGYVPTPKALAQRMVIEAELEPGMSVLEPSAGKGDIAQGIRAAGIEPDVIELQSVLRDILTLKGFSVVGTDFLTFGGRQYDRILMNPPFEDGADLTHVQHAYELLKPGGRLVAIMSEGPFFRQDKKATAFRAWLESVGGDAQKLAQGTFLESDNPTGVSTRLVVIDKSADANGKPGSDTAERSVPPVQPLTPTPPVNDNSKAPSDAGAQVITLRPRTSEGPFVPYEKRIRILTPTTGEPMLPEIDAVRFPDLGHGDVRLREMRAKDRSDGRVAGWLHYADCTPMQRRLEEPLLIYERRVRATDFSMAWRDAHAFALGQLTEAQRIAEILRVQTQRSEFDRIIEPIWKRGARPFLDDVLNALKRAVPVGFGLGSLYAAMFSAIRAANFASDTFARLIVTIEYDVLVALLGELYRTKLTTEEALTEYLIQWANEYNAAKIRKQFTLDDFALRMALYKARRGRILASWPENGIATLEALAPHLRPELVSERTRNVTALIRTNGVRSKLAADAELELMRSQNADLCFAAGLHAVPLDAALAHPWFIRGAFEAPAEYRQVLVQLGVRLPPDTVKEQLAAWVDSEGFHRGTAWIAAVAALAPDAQIEEALRWARYHHLATLRGVVADTLAAELRKREQKASVDSAQNSTVGSSCPPDMPACKLGLIGGVCGLPAELVLAASQGAPIAQVARYCLTSARRLIASHDPMTFSLRADYPREVQERRYEADKAEQLKVIGIAQNMNPALVFNTSPSVTDGTPVVTEDGIVLGGNGRTLGIQRHYLQGGSVPKDYLLAHAASFGFTEAQVRQVPDPVIVRVLDIGETDDAEESKRRLRQLVRVLNVPLTQEMDTRTSAVALARQLDEGALDTIGRALDGDTTLAEYLSSRASRDLTLALQRVGIFSERNLSRYIDGERGIYTDEGKRLVEKVIAAAVVPDAKLLEVMGAELQQTLARGAPWILAAASSGPEWDLRPAITAAVKDLIAMRAGRLRSVQDFLHQDALFPGEAPAVLQVSLGKAMLHVLHQVSGAPLRFARFAQSFVSDARQNPSGQAALFAAEKITPAEAVRRACLAANLDVPP